MKEEQNLLFINMIAHKVLSKEFTMPKVLLFLILLITLGLGANPITHAYIQQIWFNEDGELIVQFGRHAAYLANYEMEVMLSDGTNSVPLTLTETNPQNYPIEYNLTEIAPQLTFNPESGYFKMSRPYILEEIRWGFGPLCQVSPLVGSQTYYQYMLFEYTEWGDTIVHYLWAKSTSAAEVQDYECQTYSPLYLSLRNQQNEPLVGFRMHLDGFNWPHAISDENGIINTGVRCRRTNLIIYAPEGAEELYSQSFWAEPGENYTYNAIINYTGNDDPTAPMAEVKLSLKPSVIRAGKTMQVDCSEALGHSATLYLFDIKGRQLEHYPFAGNMPLHTENLPAGIYFLRLQQGDQTLDTQRFIILK